MRPGNGRKPAQLTDRKNDRSACSSGGIFTYALLTPARTIRRLSEAFARSYCLRHSFYFYSYFAIILQVFSAVKKNVSVLGFPGGIRKQLSGCADHIADAAFQQCFGIIKSFYTACQKDRYGDCIFDGF